MAARRLPPSLTWLSVFLPALVYVLTTRLGNVRSPGTVVNNVLQTTDCHRMAQLFRLHDSCSGTARTTVGDTTSNNIGGTMYNLRDPLYLVQESGLGQIGHQVWKHDEELGRGYILSSDVSGKGRVWRWEVGGGPIAIGRTLHLDQAGCRSRELCAGGAGGIAVDFGNKDHYREGRLVVAEWGEERIARLEENGARTPLVLQVPDPCHPSPATRRVSKPTRLLYTPFGDLLFIDLVPECQTSVLYRLKHATHVAPLPSLASSREAHAWNHLDYPYGVPDILYQTNKSILGDISIANDWTSAYVSVSGQDGAGLLRVALTIDDEDESTENNKVSTLVFLSDMGVSLENKASPIEVTQNGIVFWGMKDTILVLDQGRVLGHVPVPTSPQSLTLGEDGYLYVATSTQLLRVYTKERPVKVPTNMVLRLTTLRTE